MDPTIRKVCWFLTALAVMAGLGLLREAINQFRRDRFTVSVADREVRLEIRLIAESESSSRKNPWLYAVTHLRLLRSEAGAARELRATVEQFVTRQAAASHTFLDEWALGTRHQVAMRPGGPLELEPEPAWRPLYGLAVLTWMMGSFAWTAWGAASPRDASPPVSWRFASLAVLLAVTTGQAAIEDHLVELEEQAINRHMVSGKIRHVSPDGLLDELRGLGVRFVEPDQVRAFLAEQTLRYCQYEWRGRKLRSGRVRYLPDGEPCGGRLNPADPRDIILDY